MKKLSVFLLLCLTSLGLMACSARADAAPGSGSAAPVHTDGGSADITEAQTGGSGSSDVQEDPNSRVFHDCTVTVTGYSLRTDADGKTALRVEYQFTNHSQSSTSFSTTVLPSAYQVAEGSSLSEADPLEYASPAEPDTQHSAMLTRIEPGASVTCAAYYALSSSELPVTLVIQDLRDSTADALTRTLDIEGLTVETAPLVDPATDAGSAAAD